MYAFAASFSDRYFPPWNDWLQADVETDYSKIKNSAPAAFQAHTQEDYDEIPQSDEASTIVLVKAISARFALALSLPR